MMLLKRSRSKEPWKEALQAVDLMTMLRQLRQESRPIFSRLCLLSITTRSLAKSIASALLDLLLKFMLSQRKLSCLNACAYWDQRHLESQQLVAVCLREPTLNWSISMTSYKSMALSVKMMKLLQLNSFKLWLERSSQGLYSRTSLKISLRLNILSEMEPLLQIFSASNAQKICAKRE